MTQRQWKMLSFIRAYHKTQRYSPSYREIMEACAISSSSVVAYNLRQLAERGYVNLTPHKFRAIALTQEQP